MSDLTITDAAYYAAEIAHIRTGGDLDATLRAAAPMIVAAALRRLADEIMAQEVVDNDPNGDDYSEDYLDGVEAVVTAIRNRAVKLERGAR